MAKSNKENLKMNKVVLCTCFIPHISHPIVDAHGEKGAGKTFLDLVFRKVVDPSQVPILSFPRDQANLAQQLAHHYCPRYDNVSRIQPWISDVLCRAVSGEGFTKRELYSDDEDIIYKFRRCIGLNGINVAATATDLMDRVILVEMDRIEGTKRKEELRLWDDFERDKPKILGAIFGLVSKAMGIKGSLVISELPRMADFAVWGEAIWRAMGEKYGGFLELYAKNLEAKNQEVVSGTPVAAAIVELMDSKPEWQGPATSLLEALETAAKELKLDTDAKSWPKAPHILTRRLKEVISNLREIGIQITFMVVGKAKVISITKVGKNSGGSE